MWRFAHLSPTTVCAQQVSSRAMQWSASPGLMVEKTMASGVVTLTSKDSSESSATNARSGLSRPAVPCTGQASSVTFACMACAISKRSEVSPLSAREILLRAPLARVCAPRASKARSALPPAAPCPPRRARCPGRCRPRIVGPQHAPDWHFHAALSSRHVQFQENRWPLRTGAFLLEELWQP